MPIMSGAAIAEKTEVNLTKVKTQESIVITRQPEMTFEKMCAEMDRYRKARRIIETSA